MSRDRTLAWRAVGLLGLVVVTVGFTAVVAVTVLGVGDRPAPERPDGSFTFDQSTATYPVPSNETVTVDVVTLVYERGDPLDSARVDVRVNGSPAYGVERVATSDETGRLRAVRPFETATVDPGSNATVALATNASLDAGERITDDRVFSDAGLSPGDTVRVVYDGRRRTYVLDSYEVEAN